MKIVYKDGGVLDGCSISFWGDRLMVDDCRFVEICDVEEITEASSEGVSFETSNCHGDCVSWEYSSVNELRDNYLNNTDIPDGQDPIIRCEINGIQVFCKSFDNLCHFLGFSNID